MVQFFNIGNVFTGCKAECVYVPSEGQYKVTATDENGDQEDIGMFQSIDAAVEHAKEFLTVQM